MNSNSQSAIQVVIALATVALCVTIHEFGHAIASVLTGGVVTQFAVFEAHPHIHVLSPAHGATQSIRIAAGSGLVLLIWLASGLMSWGSRKWFSFKVFSIFAGVELTGWLLSCLRMDPANQANDATDFLASSGTTGAVLIQLVLLVATTGGLIMFFGRQRCESLSSIDAQAAASSSDV